MVFYFWVTRTGILRPYLPSSNVVIRMQVCGFHLSLSFSQYILNACFELRLLVWGAHHVGSSILETIFFHSSHLRSSMVYQTFWLLEPGPSVLCISLQRRGPMPLFGSELCLFGMFLNHMHMDGYLLICETQGIVFVLKKHSFWEGSFYLDFERGLVTIHMTLPPPMFFISQLLLKDEIIFWGNWITIL